jgi:hypothetical protein
MYQGRVSGCKMGRMSTRRRRHQAPLLQEFLRQRVRESGEGMQKLSKDWGLHRNQIDKMIALGDDCQVPIDPDVYRKIAQHTGVSLDTVLWMAGYRDKDEVLAPIATINDILLRAGCPDEQRVIIVGLARQFLQKDPANSA